MLSVSSGTHEDVRLPAARSALAPRHTAAERLKVMSAHAHALHLLSDSGELVSMGDTRAVALPTQWRVPGACVGWHGLQPGDTAHVSEDGSLTWKGHDGHTRTIVSVREWHPTRVRRSPATTTVSDAVKQQIQEAATPHDSGPLDAFSRSLMDMDVSQILASAHALVGGGPGLTPAGDDMICGALLAARSLGWRAPNRLLQNMERLLPRTSALSAACIRSALQGYAVTDVVRLVDAAVQRKVLAPSVIASVASIGHSSGADLLAGIAAVHRLDHQQAHHFICPNPALRLHPEQPAPFHFERKSSDRSH